MVLTLPIFTQAQTNINLTTLDNAMTGPRTQVLVLGTVHLSELPAGFDAKALDPLLDQLAGFKPEIITIEALSGEECDLALRHPVKYGSDYCAATTLAKTATGLDVPAAMAAVDAMLKTLPTKPTPAQRRQLAALFLAANDRASAYVQWLQLASAEQRAGDGLTETLVTMLGEISQRNNENYLIAARLAARLGLQRVFATDNHTGDNIAYTDKDAFGREVMAAWGAGRGAFDQRETQVQALTKAADLLPLYRYINESAHLQVLAEVNVSAALRATSTTGYPQIWVSGWDIRNLRMVANIAETFREQPGARVLSVVGVSHKPWFDQWLGQLQGVDVVGVEAVLE
ncbi:hypothetical protein EOE67_15560 [Rheinheimera riviphila]|uniref:Uncharacterized protein n=2 Tax=Rheinheimera riviphila TaxID=1834037 RepID=A0A437QJ36_9GAMM|nr:hypothetical protein EOE67_15560 [Rheinheimera riviphila]